LNGPLPGTVVADGDPEPPEFEPDVPPEGVVLTVLGTCRGEPYWSSGGVTGVLGWVPRNWESICWA